MAAERMKCDTAKSRLSPCSKSSKSQVNEARQGFFETQLARNPLFPTVPELVNMTKPSEEASS